MTITIDELFKHSYVISIDDARLEILKKTFGYGQLPIPKTYQGFQFKKYRQRKYQNQDFQEITVSPILNCAYSHASIIKLAKELDWPFVCIFEDDAYPCYDIKTKLKFYLKNVPDDCECLLLGNNGYIKCGPYNNNFIRILSMSFGTHAYVIFKSGYDKILNNYNTNYAVSDLVYAGMKVYSPKFNLFIQYNQKQGMNRNKVGYIWFGRKKEQIFKEFPRFELIQEHQMFIKFIIPAYNAEKTLPKMLDSILNQTFQDFKVIVVDDVSTDNTWNVISEYQQKYPDKIIGIKSKEKTFAGGARNLGIAYPLESTYTWFVDADDWLNGNDVLQIVYDRYLETNADVFKIDCNMWKYQEWAAPWWRILKSELVCEFQPNLRTCDDVGNYHLVKEKIKGKHVTHIQNKPLYFYTGSHDCEHVNYSKEIQEWLQKMKNEMNNSSIMKTIFQFWTDNTQMSEARKAAIETSKNLTIETTFVNQDNLNKYIVEGHPLHPAYQYLSAVHKSDYLRCYFMHFHGGGYADIKPYTTQNNWKECFDYMDSHKECLVIGQKEIVGGSPIRKYNNEPYLSHLIANGYFIFRSNTEFTRKWLERVENILTRKYELLKLHPGLNPRQQGGEYPLAWAEICGSVLHQLEIEFKDIPGAIVRNLKSGRTYTEWK